MSGDETRMLEDWSELQPAWRPGEGQPSGSVHSCVFRPVSRRWSGPEGFAHSLDRNSSVRPLDSVIVVDPSLPVTDRI